MGLRRIEILYSLGVEGRVCASVYDEHVIDAPVVWVRRCVLDLGQEFPEVDGEEYGA